MNRKKGTCAHVSKRAAVTCQVCQVSPHPHVTDCFQTSHIKCTQFVPSCTTIKTICTRCFLLEFDHGSLLGVSPPPMSPIRFKLYTKHPHNLYFHVPQTKNFVPVWFWSYDHRSLWGQPPPMTANLLKFCRTYVLNLYFHVPQTENSVLAWLVSYTRSNLWCYDVILRNTVNGRNSANSYRRKLILGSKCVF